MSCAPVAASDLMYGVCVCIDIWLALPKNRVQGLFPQTFIIIIPRYPRLNWRARYVGASRADKRLKLGSQKIYSMPITALQKIGKCDILLDGAYEDYLIVANYFLLHLGKGACRFFYVSKTFHDPPKISSQPTGWVQTHSLGNTALNASI